MAAGKKPRLSALFNTHSYFSFGAATSSPTSLVEKAYELGYEYLGLSDLHGVYGAVELHKACQKKGMKALTGASVTLEHIGQSYPLNLFASSQKGYKVLNDLLSYIHATESKTTTLAVLMAHTEDIHCLSGGRKGYLTQLFSQRKITEAESISRYLKEAFPNRFWVQLYYDHYPNDKLRIRKLRDFARANRLSVVAAPEVRYASADLYPLYDALVCARLGITVDEPHRDRPQNDAQAIPDPEALPIPFEEAIANANELAKELAFELLPERLSSPPARVPAGLSPEKYLEERCYEALAKKYSGDLLRQARERFEQELVTLKALGLTEFFLTAAEITDFCKRRGIVASGRGSAAASVVCYLLGITGTDPISNNLLFERFLHTGKTAMPDIDIDIASSRRDEVLAWVEERFSCEAMVCNRITYKLPSAIQDIGRALGVPPDIRNLLSQKLGRDFRGLRPHQAGLAEAIFTEVFNAAPVKAIFMALLKKMERGMVRHVAPHSGGVVLSKQSISYYAPVERSSGGIRFLQFDKDDAEALGLIKLDLLGLRMLGAIERTREEVLKTEATWLDIDHLPDDKRVWQSIHQGDTMGLFQIESPGQVRMSVQLKPENLSDLAHQVALFRPGPIQSNTVHPYVRRRKKAEKVEYMHPLLEPILAKSYGVLLFQEDILRIAVHFAGMSWNEAENFRKKIAKYEDEEEIRAEYDTFMQGAMHKSKATFEEAQAIFENLSQFRGFGFAESHAWAFALHAYASAYLRLHYPAEYLASVMTESPGMWSHSTLRQEAKRWEVGFAYLDINHSGMAYSVEAIEGYKRLRPPLTAVKGVSEELASKIVLERLRGAYKSIEDLYARLIIKKDVLEALARAGAFDRLQVRREALYKISALANTQTAGQSALFSSLPDTPPMPALSLKEQITWDYTLKGLNEQGIHPIDLIRHDLRRFEATPFCFLNEGWVRTAGLVVSRQKPPTARGFAFFVLEDGEHRVQLIISPDLWEEERETFRDAPVLLAEGQLYKEGMALCLKAAKVWGLKSKVVGRGYLYG